MDKVKKPPIIKSILAFIFRFGFSLRYSVKIINKEIISDSRSKIFLPNHQSLIEPIILISEVYRYSEISPAVTAKYFKSSFFKTMMSIVSAIPVNDVESGKRDLNVIKTVQHKFNDFIKDGKNVLLYPSGQLSNDGTEKLYNKQGAYNIVSNLPDDVLIIGVRINGFWGSMWSKYKSGKTPDFMKVLLTGGLIILLNFIFFTPRRIVSFEFVNLTEEIKKMKNTDRKTFNLFLEGFYNKELTSEVNIKKYFFFS